MMWVWRREQTATLVISQGVSWYLVFSSYPLPLQVFACMTACFVSFKNNKRLCLDYRVVENGWQTWTLKVQKSRKKTKLLKVIFKTQSRTKTILIHPRDSGETGRTDSPISFFSSLGLLKYKRVRDMSYSLKMDVACFFLFRPPRDDILCVVITKRIRRCFYWFHACLYWTR